MWLKFHQHPSCSGCHTGLAPRRGHSATSTCSQLPTSISGASHADHPMSSREHWNHMDLRISSQPTLNTTAQPAPLALEKEVGHLATFHCTEHPRSPRSPHSSTWGPGGALHNEHNRGWPAAGNSVTASSRTTQPNSILMSQNFGCWLARYGWPRQLVPSNCFPLCSCGSVVPGCSIQTVS